MVQYTIEMECFYCNKKMDVDLARAQESQQHSNNREIFCSNECAIKFFKIYK